MLLLTSACKSAPIINWHLYGKHTIKKTKLILDKLIKKIKKEVGITIILVVSYLAEKSLITHSTDNVGYYLCLFVQTQFQLGSYINSCTNETHSQGNLQDLIPILASLCCL